MFRRGKQNILLQIENNSRIRYETVIRFAKHIMKLFGLISLIRFFFLSRNEYAERKYRVISIYVKLYTKRRSV